MFSNNIPTKNCFTNTNHATKSCENAGPNSILFDSFIPPFSPHLSRQCSLRRRTARTYLPWWFGGAHMLPRVFLNRGGTKSGGDVPPRDVSHIDDRQSPH